MSYFIENPASKINILRLSYSTTFNGRTGALISSALVVLMVLVLLFVSPGAVKVVIDVVASHHGYRDDKNQYQDQQDHPRTR